MYVAQSLACSVPNSTTPISAVTLAKSAARVAAQDAQSAALLQNWMSMIDRTPESFTNTLHMPPSQFTAPQTAVALLDMDENNDAISTGADSMAEYRAGAVCNPPKAGPKIIPLNGVIAALPATQVLNLQPRGPLGPVYGKVISNSPGVSGYHRGRVRRSAGVSGACHCGGTCGHCHSGLGDGVPLTGPGSGIVWGAIAGTAFMVWAAFFNKPSRRSR